MISVQPDDADPKTMSREAAQQSQYSQFKQHLRDFLVMVGALLGGGQQQRRGGGARRGVELEPGGP
jgi:hypothetical protein